jgi:hypothetical protein
MLSRIRAHSQDVLYIWPEPSVQQSIRLIQHKHIKTRALNATRRIAEDILQTTWRANHDVTTLRLCGAQHL